MIKRLFLVVALAACPLVANAAMPYDAVGRLSPPGKTWGGSCVLIYAKDGKGLIVTNAHVTCGRSDWVATWHNGSRKAKVVAYLKDVDLSFLVVEDPPVPAAHLGMRDSHIVFAGYPHYERTKLHWQYGNVESEGLTRTRWVNKPVPGMSGGAVFDRKDGDLCGIVEASKDNYGIGISDVTLIVFASKYEDPKTWVEDSAACLADKLEPGSLAKPSKTVVTKDADDVPPPVWELPDEEND